MLIHFYAWNIIYHIKIVINVNSELWNQILLIFENSSTIIVILNIPSWDQSEKIYYVQRSGP